MIIIIIAGGVWVCASVGVWGSGQAAVYSRMAIE